MLLKIALLLSMIFQLGAAIIAISMIRRTRYNVSWIMISAGFVLMAVRRLFDFSVFFWETKLFSNGWINSWVAILISLLLFIGVLFIRQIFNLQDHIDKIRKENESRILSAVIQTEEKDRQIFARELHDGLGPVLSSIKMTMSAVNPDYLDPANKEIIQRSCRVTDEAIVTLREISNQLSPHLLQNFGLIHAIKTFADNLLSQTSTTWTISSGIEKKRYNYELEINIYRIACELFNNSKKHAKAAHIDVELQEIGQVLHLSYLDDGYGFNMDQDFKFSTGMGLENIRSRIKSLNGILQINSSPEEGFAMYAQFPIFKK